MWLDDGVSRGDGFATNDIEILRAWYEWTDKNDMEITHSGEFQYCIRQKGQGTKKPIHKGSIEECNGCKKTESIFCANLCELKTRKHEIEESLYDSLYIWRITEETKIDVDEIKGKKRISNNFMKLLKYYNLIDNKHIPKVYINNSVNIRLQLLAGLIDTDGNLHRKSFRFSQTIKRKQICIDIIDISRSLGFTTSYKNVSTKDVTFPHGKEYKMKDQCTIRIMGATHIIPTKVLRKQQKEISKSKNECITIIPDVVSKYVGWSVSGGSQRFLLGDGTITHNCTKPGCETSFDWKTGKKIDHSRNTNPHYYAFRAANGGMPRDPLDIPCGGLPPIRNTMAVFQKYTRDVDGAEIQRSVAHNQTIMLPQYAPPAVTDNIGLTVKFLMKEMSEEKYERELRARHKKREKLNSVHPLLDMYTQTLSDMIIRISGVRTQRDFDTVFSEMLSLQEYTNKELEKLAKEFDNVMPIIRNFYITTKERQLRRTTRQRWA